MPKQPAAPSATSAASDLLALKGRRRFAPCKAAAQYGLTYRMRSLTERERSAYEAKLLHERKGTLDPRQLQRSKCLLIVNVLVDDDGNPLFSDHQIGDLMELDSAITDAIYRECSDHVGYADGDVENLLGNSGTTAADGSPSA